MTHYTGGRNMKKLRKFAEVGIILIMFFAIIAFHYNYRLNIRKQPPSQKWAKETLISSGQVSTQVKAIKFQENYIVTHNDGGDIKLLLIDKLGNKLNEKTINDGRELISDLNLFNKSEYIYLNWTHFDKGVKISNLVKFDNELNELEKQQIENVVDNIKINENLLLVSYEDRLEIIDIDTNKVITIDENNVQSIAAAEADNRYLITYYDIDDSMFKYFYYVEGEVTEPSNIIRINKNPTISFENVVLSIDKETAYILYEQEVKGSYNGTKYIKLSFKNNESEVGDLEYGSNKFFRNLSSAKSENGARVLATCIRRFGKNDIHKDVVDFVIKDGKITEYNFGSRSKNLSIFPYAVGDMLIYADYSSQKDYNIYMTSESEEAKAVNNIITKEEKKATRIDVLEGILFSFANLMIIAMVWIIPSVMIISIFSFLQYKLNEKISKKLYLVVCTVCTIIKLLYIKRSFYPKNSFYFPDVIASTTAVMAICIGISFITYLFSYMKFKKDSEKSAIFTLIPTLVLDSLLTLMVFIPFTLNF